MAHWLITWEVCGNKDIQDGAVAAIMNYRCSCKTVMKMMEMLYINYSSTLQERLQYARNGYTPYHAYLDVYNGKKWQGRIQCGHNPYLFARLVDNLKVEIDKQGNEKLSYSERPIPDGLK